jgi:excisionase family DNA binding protein
MSSTALPNKALLRPDEASEWFGKSKRTIYDWMHDGKLSFVLDPAGHKRILREDIERFSNRSSDSDLIFIND